MKNTDQNTCADMYLPRFALTLGIIMGVIAAGLCIGACFAENMVARIILLCVGIGCVLLGLAAYLCWKNQKIRVLSETHFEYTTFLGNSRVYAFDDITDLKLNSDSSTLLVGGKKIHIEACAIMSDRLIEYIEDSL